MAQVRESLMSRAADFGIILEDVAITHLSFGPEVRLAFFPTMDDDLIGTGWTFKYLFPSLS